MTEARLKLGRVPPHPFVNVPFEVDVILLDHVDRLITNDNIPLLVKCCFEGSPPIDCPPEVLTVHSPATIGHLGAVTVSVQLNALSMDYSNKSFLLHFSTDSSTSNNDYIVPIISTPIYSIRHQVVLKEIYSGPYVWYKDEGGRDKHIELKLSLVDASGTLVTNRSVHLKVTLLYQNGTVVGNQDILMMPIDSQPCIENGEGSVRFRIDSVSKGHQSQSFCAYVEPDTAVSPYCGDINTVTSLPVQVRSKRNNNSKKKDSNITRTVSNNNPDEDQELEPVFHASNGSTVKKRKSGDMIPRRVSNNNGMPAPYTVPPLNGGTYSSFNHTSSTVSALDPERSGQPASVKKVMSWARRVVDDLQKLAWTPMGYEANGASPTGPLLYAMPNPNQTIDGILSQYTNDEVENTLLNLPTSVPPSQPSNNNNILPPPALISSKRHENGNGGNGQDVVPGPVPHNDYYEDDNDMVLVPSLQSSISWNCNLQPALSDATNFNNQARMSPSARPYGVYPDKGNSRDISLMRETSLLRDISFGLARGTSLYLNRDTSFGLLANVLDGTESDPKSMTSNMDDKASRMFAGGSPTAAAVPKIGDTVNKSEYSVKHILAKVVRMSAADQQVKIEGSVVLTVGKVWRKGGSGPEPGVLCEPNEVVGLPAFDYQGKLIGFYREMVSYDTGVAVTCVIFSATALPKTSGYGVGVQGSWNPMADTVSTVELGLDDMLALEKLLAYESTNRENVDIVGGTIESKENVNVKHPNSIVFTLDDNFDYNQSTSLTYQDPVILDEALIKLRQDALIATWMFSAAPLMT